jgi:hypothetical protein
MTAISAEWWVCFPCWIAYHVPTTFYYGTCEQCGRPTRAWPAERERLTMLEMRVRS